MWVFVKHKKMLLRLTGMKEGSHHSKYPGCSRDKPTPSGHWRLEASEVGGGGGGDRPQPSTRSVRPAHTCARWGHRGTGSSPTRCLGKVSGRASLLGRSDPEILPMSLREEFGCLGAPNSGVPTWSWPSANQCRPSQS